jgi:hypothetical protein
MTHAGPRLWRALFLAAAVLLVAGGSMHPRSGTVGEMLMDPLWVRGHALTTAGFAAMLAALALVLRAGGLPPRTHLWMRLAAVATAGQVVEMVVHTAAVVDRHAMAAGGHAPVVSAHLAMAVVLYPLFGVATAGLIVAGARDRTLGAWWIAPLGLVGVLAHGFAPPLTLWVDDRFRILFPGVALFAVWMALAALWPRRLPAAAAPAPRAPALHGSGVA